MRPEIKLNGERPFNNGWVKQWSFKFGSADFQLELYFEGVRNGVIYWRETFHMSHPLFKAHFKKELSKKLPLSEWRQGSIGPSFASNSSSMLVSMTRAFELKWAGRTIDFWDGPGSGGGNERRELRIESAKSALTYDVTGGSQ